MIELLKELETWFEEEIQIFGESDEDPGDYLYWRNRIRENLNSFESLFGQN
jgi:hypothetical protein